MRSQSGSRAGARTPHRRPPWWMRWRPSTTGTGLPQVWVLTSGPLPPNPAELLASESMVALLRDLEARADLVIFDSPPLGPLTDAVVLSARVSGTLLVVQASSTRRTLVTNSVNMV